MSLPICEWSISQSCDLQVPDVVHAKVLCHSCVNDNDVINVRNFGSYNKLIRITAIILKAAKIRSFKIISFSPSTDDIAKAKRWWIRCVQNHLPEDWEIWYRRLGPMVDKEGLACVGQSIAPWLKDNWNMKAFILIPRNHNFTRLYVQHIHDIDYASVEVILARLQSMF